jgi:peptidoglycan/xylan/chitin deacetylase (PgdA/CDA1 family)
MKQTYFSHLDKEFAEFFREGIPILLYHMVAPLPSDKKLKGLYIPPRSFEQQLKELSKAGFTSAPLDSVFLHQKNDPRKVVLSFDDAFVSVLENAMEALAIYHFNAIQFVVADLIGKSNQWDLVLGPKQLPIMNTNQIREWIAEGHEIGSHGLTHPYLTRISLNQAREEIFSSKKKLEDQFGTPVDHFCYPYGDFNQTIRDLVSEAGYRTASTTIFGVNCSSTDPFQLNRIKGRHRTRRLSSFVPWLKSSRS